MGEKTTKTVKVSASTAEEWDEYVEENAEVDSVSHLIRLSVQKEISGEYDIEQRRESRSVEGSEATEGEVLTQLRKVNTAIGDVEERLSALEETEKAEAGFDLKKAIHSNLEVVAWTDKERGNWDESDLEFHDSVHSAQDVAESIGADTADVRSKMEKMAKESGIVEIAEMDSGRVYAWRAAK
ncbi:hypothetical protein I7X12_10590 [Halosimplex litoreum]|uniref:Uncharacterized protein n=1 Tax=Halosimplex litoreum TaxID=1198301 RepID=A0A7T3FV44_9EURY|nr:hypothetical protein [Halosimplex litoreum]QPV61221.1 hypothetical protein I7X12_10590 [Halosimplex litoreum]